MSKRLVGLAFAAAAVWGCAATGGGVPPGADMPRWPFAGLYEAKDQALEVFRDRFFSGSQLEIDPAGRVLYAETGRPGALTRVSVPDGRILSVFDFGNGSITEDLLFDSDGRTLYVVASTVRGENYGQVPLARALLKIDEDLPMMQVAIPLEPRGYSHGLAMISRSGVLFSLESAGADLPGGGRLARIDLIGGDRTRSRLVGALPAGVRRRGLVADDRANHLYALITDGGGGADFTPVPRGGARGARSGGASHGRPSTWLVVIDPDSLGAIEKLPLQANVEYSAVVSAPDGVLVVGNTRHGAVLAGVDTRLMRESGWLDIPEVVSDVAVAGSQAFLSARNGIYVVDLGLVTLSRFIPLRLERPGDLAVTPDGRTACVIMEVPDRPGIPAVATINLETGHVEGVTQ